VKKYGFNKLNLYSGIAVFILSVVIQILWEDYFDDEVIITFYLIGCILVFRGIYKDAP